MLHNVRYAVILFVVFFLGYFSYRSYLYYFDNTAPEVTVSGLQDGTYYTGDIAVNLKGKSPYKVSHLSMWIDDRLMQDNVKINQKNFEHPLAVSTSSLPDGEHRVKFEVVDGTRRQNKSSIEKVFYVDNQTLQAALVSSVHDHKVQQGRCLHVQIQVNKPHVQASIKAVNHQYPFFPKSLNSLVYEAFVPLECEQLAQEYPFAVEVKDYVGNSVMLEDKFQVLPVPFKKKILHVQNNKLKSELEYTSLQERDLEQALERLAKSSVKEKLWKGAFDVPILMTGVSTEFGVIRTSQERGRTVHKALDLTATPKAVVWAAQDGVVVLKDRFTHSGNTVVVDHGHGVLSLYFHLHDFADIEVGQKLKKGNPVGRMGMTGFANGHHLHWEIRVNNIAVDPMQWTELKG